MPKWEVTVLIPTGVAERPGYPRQWVERCGLVCTESTLEQAAAGTLEKGHWVPVLRIRLPLEEIRTHK